LAGREILAEVLIWANSPAESTADYRAFGLLFIVEDHAMVTAPGDRNAAGSEEQKQYGEAGR
jgi:hypothetical protein